MSLAVIDEAPDSDISSSSTTISDDRDDRDEAASQEIPIYRCGTFAPGQVHDPCQHSMFWVKCCGCAGCLNDSWQCGRPLPGELYIGSTVLDEQTDRFVHWMGTPAGLMTSAVLGIAVLTSGVIPAFLDAMLLIVLVTGALVVGDLGSLQGWW